MLWFNFTLGTIWYFPLLWCIWKGNKTKCLYVSRSFPDNLYQANFRRLETCSEFSNEISLGKVNFRCKILRSQAKFRISRNNGLLNF